jgi:putative two-component system response regulator
LFGRICAVADTFDALTTDRPYRPALPNCTVYEMMMAERERHFDPDVLDVFFSLRPAVEEIQEKFRDREEASDSPATRADPGLLRPATLPLPPLPPSRTA